MLLRGAVVGHVPPKVLQNVGVHTMVRMEVLELIRKPNWRCIEAPSLLRLLRLLDGLVECLVGSLLYGVPASLCTRRCWAKEIRIAPRLLLLLEFRRGRPLRSCFFLGLLRRSLGPPTAYAV